MKDTIDIIESISALTKAIRAEMGGIKTEVLLGLVRREVRDSLKRGIEVSEIDKLYMIHKITNNRFLQMEG